MYSPDLVGWVVFSWLYSRIANFSLDTARATQVQRGFLSFSELSQTTDCAGQESKANKQEGDPESPRIAETVTDAQLHIEIRQKRHNEQESSREHDPEAVGSLSFALLATLQS